MTYTGDWYGLYRERWGDDIVPDAYAHPAKFARGLIRRIYAHLLERGYLQPGDTVLDPFGGVALGGLDAMLNGLHWIGNELEGKFVDLGQQNIEHWIKRYQWLWADRWGSAVLLQGDSRHLGQVLAEAGGLVSSPPFGEGETRDRAPVQAGEVADCITRAYTQDRQGTTPGNLAHMKAVISSPPYLNKALGDGEGPGAAGERHGRQTSTEKAWTAGKEYGDTEGQLAQESPDDFWTAARAIIDQCYMILKPGAVAVWVVKRFVRDKQIVNFPDQWRQMCEAAGFETVEWIRAWVVEEHGEQLDLFGGSEPMRTERKSFFRRLYENKYPENSIDWEDVLIMRRLPRGERYAGRSPRLP